MPYAPEPVGPSGRKVEMTCAPAGILWMASRAWRSPSKRNATGKPVPHKTYETTTVRLVRRCSRGCQYEGLDAMTCRKGANRACDGGRISATIEPEAAATMVATVGSSQAAVMSAGAWT